MHNAARSFFNSHLSMLIGLVLFSLVVLSSDASANSDPIVIVCNDCNSTPQFNHAATGAIPFDGSFSSVNEVYVVNIVSEEARALRVSTTTIDPDPFFFGDEVTTTTVESISGDPAMMQSLVELYQAVHDFWAALASDVPTEELDLEFDSALDLIGGPLAARNLRELENALRSRYEAEMNQFSTRINELFAVAFGFFNVRSPLFNPGSGYVEIVFPDGSTIIAQVNAKENLEDRSELIFVASLDLTTIRAPGQNWIPFSAAELEGFDFSTRNPELSQEFQDLLRRLGAEVRAPGGSSGSEFCTTTISCSPNTGSPDEPEWRCQVSIEDC